MSKIEFLGLLIFSIAVAAPLFWLYLIVLRNHLHRWCFGDDQMRHEMSFERYLIDTLIFIFILMLSALFCHNISFIINSVASTLAAIVSSIISGIVTMIVNIVVLIVIIAIGFAIVTNKQRSQQQDTPQTAAEQKENEQEVNDEFGSLLGHIASCVVIFIIWLIFLSIMTNPDYKSIHSLVIIMMLCLWLALVVLAYVGDFRPWLIKHLFDEDSNAKPPRYLLILMDIILFPFFLLIVVFVMVIRGGTGTW